jgi:hypothetical protein
MNDEQIERIKSELHFALSCLNDYRTEEGMYDEIVNSLQYCLEHLTGSRWKEIDNQ